MSSAAGRFGGSTMGSMTTNQQLDAAHTVPSTGKSAAQKTSPAPTAAAVSGSSQAGPASVSTGASASKP
jgi:hypothetical protein